MRTSRHRNHKAAAEQFSGAAQIYTRDNLNRDVALESANSIRQTTNRSHLNIDRTGTNDDRFGYYLDGEMNWASYDSATFKDSTYTLDKAGNRTQVYDGSVWKTYTPDALNQYSQGDGLPVTNNAERQISAFDGLTFTYKDDGRLAMVFNGTTWTTFSYDALGRCVKRVRDNWDAKYSYYDGERELLECGPGGGAAFKNLYGQGIDEILRRIDTANNWTLYYQQDQLGNVTELTWGSGDVVEIFQYDAFGALNKPASGWGNPFLFTGRRYQSTFGIYEYRARAYHPRLGRFTSSDPKLYDAGDYNLFRYCHNDPLDMTDPMGLISAPDLRTNPTVEQLAAAEKAAEALEHAYGWPGHGAINVGLAHFAAEQLSNQMGQLSRPATQSFSTSVMTAIHPPDMQTGIKSIQSVTVNSDGSYSNPDPYVGYTDFYFLKAQGSSKGTSADVKVAYPNFNITMRGHFKSASPTVGPIDYKVHIGGNFVTHKAWAWGKHDGYPSGVVFGGGQRMYEWHQHLRSDLAAPMEQYFATEAVQW